jgi:hypothetical protein
MPTDTQRRLRKSKDAERSVGKWLMKHDGPDPRMSGIASSTGRTGHITNMQIDVLSKSYACEVKNIRLGKTLANFWLKIIGRAIEHRKDPLMVIVPSNTDPKVPELHVITAARHAELLEFESRQAQRVDMSVRP